MDQLKFYLKKWNLTAPEKLAETATSHVYKADQERRPVVLKLLTPLGRLDEAGGPMALRHFSGRGAVELLDCDEGAHLVSFIDGHFLKSLVMAGKDFEATEIICDVLEKIHAASGEMPTGLISMEENFRALFSHAKDSHGGSLLNRAAQLAERLIATEQERVVLHGDVHHKNILESSVHGWLLIDPKGLIGERANDMANVFYNPDDRPQLVESRERIQRVCSAFSGRFKMDPVRILEFAFTYGCLSSCWAIDDGLNPDRRWRIAKMIFSMLQD